MTLKAGPHGCDLDGSRRGVLGCAYHTFRGLQITGRNPVRPGLSELSLSYSGSLFVVPATVRSRYLKANPARIRFPLPLKSGAQLCRPRIAARIPQGKNAVCAGRLVIRVVEHVEKVHVEPKSHSLVESDELLRGCILAPLPRSNYELVPPRVQVVVKLHLLNGAVVQRNPDVVGIPEIGDIRIRRSICRKRRLPPRNQRSIRRLVIVRHAHDAVRLAIGVDAVDPVGRNVAVPTQVAGEAVAAGAILDRIFEAVDLDRIAGRIVVSSAGSTNPA